MISRRDRCTVSVGRISPPPESTCTRHWPQLPLPPQADGRNTLLMAIVDSSEPPEGASTVRWLLMFIATLPLCTRNRLATSSMATSTSVMARKMPTPASTVMPVSEAGMNVRVDVIWLCFRF